MKLLDTPVRRYLIRNPDIEKYPTKRNKEFFDENVWNIINLFFFNEYGTRRLSEELKIGSQGFYRAFLTFYFGDNYSKLANILKIKHHNFRKENRIYIDGKDVIAEKIRISNIKRVNNGTHQFLSKNRSKDSNGKDIISTKSNITRIKNGTHPFLNKNLKLDSDGKSILHKNNALIQIKNGTHNLSYNGNESHDRLVKKFTSNGFKSSYDNMIRNKCHPFMYYDNEPELNRIKYLTKRFNMIRCFSKCIEKSGYKLRSSYPEELLSNILFLLNIEYIRNIPIPNLNKSNYYPDFYIPEFDIFIECDGMFKWIYNNDELILNKFYQDRSDYIEFKTGKNILHIDSNSVFYYYKNKKSLYNLILKYSRKLKYPIIKIN